MFEVGDEVLVKGKITAIVERENYPFKVRFADMEYVFFKEEELIPADKTYTQGLADAWELAKRLYEMSGNERFDVVGYGDYANIMEFVTPEEALAKIEAYEREKEIKVGDEVVHGIGGCETKFIITSMSDGMIRGFDSNGITHSFTFPNRFITKTGKHIDIEGLLRQIGE